MKGFVASDGSLKGTLAVSRAVGDSDVLGVTAEAEINSYPLTDADEFIVVACDGIHISYGSDWTDRLGLWDVMTDDEVVSLVHNSIDKEMAARKLRDYAWMVCCVRLSIY